MIHPMKNVKGWIACSKHEGIIDAECPDCIIGGSDMSSKMWTSVPPGSLSALKEVGSKVSAAADILKEFDRASELYGSFHSAHEGYAILLEEMDELWDEVKKHRSPENYQRMMEEAVQVGAMALRFIVDMNTLKDKEGMFYDR